METIRLVKADEANDIFLVYRECAKYHAEKGFFQWDETYPTLDIVKNDIELGQLFGIYQEDECMGIISLNHDEPKEYANLTWNDQSTNYIIIHRLCINPKHMKKGLAKKLMSFSEKWTKDNGFSSIRLDTYSPNKGAIQFYSGINYIFKGEVYFEKRKEFGYSCFEKTL